MHFIVRSCRKARCSSGICTRGYISSGILLLYLIEVFLLLTLVRQASADYLLGELAAHHKLHDRLLLVISQMLVDQVLHSSK